MIRPHPVSKFNSAKKRLLTSRRRDFSKIFSCVSKKKWSEYSEDVISPTFLCVFLALKKEVL